MKSVIELLKSHRSIRRFKDIELDEGVLNEVLEAGQWASTSSFIQATSVIRISDKPLRQKFVALTGNQKYVGTAAEFLVFCADFDRIKQRINKAQVDESHDADFSWVEQFISATVDVALFAQNVVIAAESKGLGCCYIGGLRNDLNAVTELLDLPKHIFPVFGLCIGIPDQKPMQKPRLPIQTLIFENKYQYSDNRHELIDHYDSHIAEYYKHRTKGRIEHTWSEQMLELFKVETRPYIKDYLLKQGFIEK